LVGRRGAPPEEGVPLPELWEALDFVNRVGVPAEAEAEEQSHHPDIDFGWGRVGITIFTHKLDGLTESDIVLAAKVDRI